MSTSFPKRQTGLSLIELIMFMVIMGIAAAGVLQVINLSSKSSADPIMRKQALLIAEGLMEEVQMARYTFCDPADDNASNAVSPAVGANGCADPLRVENVGRENGNLRPFDNVNDYVSQYNVAQTAFNNAAGVLADASLNDMSNHNQFAATLTLSPVAGLGPAGLQIASTALPATQDALQITIVVSYATGSVRLDGYRTRYAPTSIP